ncbi:DNA-binding transcriptional regulator, MarR family [Paenibacillus sp. yr247]|uniref:MarR family winged helix-turn-helix transcriptional regulator n=1 Tax=Paenibacillus sp. yr247 TaxID=1761880 RepID=UPI000892326C|nr:MarR family winged helix-turn-helix transcriptional regulator [Paenibacillus sp. yr247]SDN19552.1 DNA-binding transcriptional regulator, MarR family [Paenibacillus sp. yr247]
MTSEYGKPYDSPGFLLWQVTNLWQKNLRQALHDLDLTHVQFILLASTEWLNTQSTQEDVTQAQIAGHAHIDPMMASQVLRNLEKKGFLIRKEHPTDTRAKSISLTQAGERMVSQALDIVVKADRRFFAKLGEDQVTLANLMRTLGSTTIHEIRS